MLVGAQPQELPKGAVGFVIEGDDDRAGLRGMRLNRDRSGFPNRKNQVALFNLVNRNSVGWVSAEIFISRLERLLVEICVEIGSHLFDFIG